VLYLTQVGGNNCVTLTGDFVAWRNGRIKKAFGPKMSAMPESFKMILLND
jgi:hypothetical protein